MALIVRIDVDRPYGRQPLARHVLSRLSSDLYFPRITALGYLDELKVILRMLNESGAQSYVFFRRCTLPSREIMELIGEGGHEIGLHLENSRSHETLAAEKGILEAHIGFPVTAMSKHGSGGGRYGYHHYAPYEPEKYVAWAREEGMKVFLGNLEDPTIQPIADPTGLQIFPAAFWLEPAWRDTAVFTVDWLLREACTRDIVLLIHPENVLSAPELTADLRRLVTTLDTKVVR